MRFPAYCVLRDSACVTSSAGAAALVYMLRLKGELADVWACTVDYDNRILFAFVENPESGEEEIHLLTVGTHDEVYRKR